MLYWTPFFTPFGLVSEAQNEKFIGILNAAQAEFGDLPVSIELEDEIIIRRVKYRLGKMSRKGHVFPGRNIIFVTGKDS